MARGLRSSGATCHPPGAPLRRGGVWWGGVGREGRGGGGGSGERGVKRAVACDRKACIPAREAVRLGKPRKVRRRGRKGSGDCKQLRDRKRGQAGITKGCGSCKVLRYRKRRCARRDGLRAPASPLACSTRSSGIATATLSRPLHRARHVRRYWAGPHRDRRAGDSRHASKGRASPIAVSTCRHTSV